MRRLLFTAVISTLFCFSNESFAMEDCPMKIDFKTADKPNWRAVNDGVMGGQSSGGPNFENDQMVFSGMINTNGGGFSSVRAPIQSGFLKGAKGLMIKLNSDDRLYKVTFRTTARYGWRKISFQASIPETPKGEWAEVFVSFSALKASVFGQPIRGVEFDKDKVEEIGIIIADGRDGPFAIKIDWIKGCPI